MDQFLKGEVVRLAWTLQNTQGSLVDNPTQTLKYIDPTSLQTNAVYTDGTVGIIHDTLGTYHYDLPVSIAGMWWIRLETGSSNQGVQEYQFEVKGTRFA